MTRQPAVGGPGQDPGHPLCWADIVAHGIARHGTLAGLANALCAERGHRESSESVERALRRLRGREGDGGVWGGRLLRLVGLPEDTIARLVWMGQYHSRFTDLPTEVGWALWRPWLSTPVMETPHAVWLWLARASLELREQRDPSESLAQVWRCKPAGAALAEGCLVAAYSVSSSDMHASLAWTDQAESAIVDCDEVDRACLVARIVDHRGFWLNVRERRHEEALALYATIPEHGPAFARVRRHSGMGWSQLRLGRSQLALEHARAAVEAAGDGGHLRLRVMALLLLFEAGGGEGALRRARAIAESLGDPTLLARVARRTVT